MMTVLLLTISSNATYTVAVAFGRLDSDNAAPDELCLILSLGYCGANRVLHELRKRCIDHIVIKQPSKMLQNRLILSSAVRSLGVRFISWAPNEAPLAVMLRGLFLVPFTYGKAKAMS